MWSCSPPSSTCQAGAEPAQPLCVSRGSHSGLRSSPDSQAAASKLSRSGTRGHGRRGPSPCEKCLLCTLPPCTGRTGRGLVGAGRGLTCCFTRDSGGFQGTAPAGAGTPTPPGACGAEWVCTHSSPSSRHPPGWAPSPERTVYPSLAGNATKISLRVFGPDAPLKTLQGEVHVSGPARSSSP